MRANNTDTQAEHTPKEFTLHCASHGESACQIVSTFSDAVAVSGDGAHGANAHHAWPIGLSLLACADVGAGLCLPRLLCELPFGIPSPKARSHCHFSHHLRRHAARLRHRHCLSYAADLLRELNADGRQQ